MLTLRNITGRIRTYILFVLLPTQENVTITQKNCRNIFYLHIRLLYTTLFYGRSKPKNLFSLSTHGKNKENLLTRFRRGEARENELSFLQRGFFVAKEIYIRFLLYESYYRRWWISETIFFVRGNNFVFWRIDWSSMLFDKIFIFFWYFCNKLSVSDLKIYFVYLMIDGDLLLNYQIRNNF